MTVTTEDQLALLDMEAMFDWAIDSGDIPAWVAGFTEDGIFEADYGKAQGTAELTKLMEDLEAGFSKGKRHVAANHRISGDQNDATVSGYLMVFEREKAPALVATGIYHNRYRKTADGWRITTAISKSTRAGRTTAAASERCRNIAPDRSGGDCGSNGLAKRQSYARLRSLRAPDGINPCQRD